MKGSLPANAHELRVYQALKQQLPADWWVLSDVHWTVRTDADQGGYVRDGQSDFVIVAPKLGMLILEVKGSRWIGIDDDGRWRRSADKSQWELVQPSPPAQATHNAHMIAERLARYWGLKVFPYTFGYVVVYPQGSIIEGSLTAFDPITVALKNQMADLFEHVRTALLSYGRKGQELTADVAKEIAAVLCNTKLMIGPIDGASDVKSDAQAIERLTDQQFAALQGVFRNPRVAVSGPAGSGKTVLAIWRLRSLVAEGKRAMYFCFNKMLAEQLKLDNPEVQSSISHVDSYFASIAPRATIAGSELEHYFNEELPGRVLDVVSQWSSDQKLDAAIVDEGQDFGAMRLWAVQELLADGATYVYCADDRQDLYDRAVRKAVGAEVVFSLTHNCRNTIEINESANRLLDEHVKPMPGLPQGTKTVVRVCKDAEQTPSVVWGLINSWASDFSRVAVLSPYRLERSSMARSQSAAGKRLVTEIAAWREQGAVLFATIKSFKGLEADAVVVVDVTEKGASNALETGDLYVACTRGRARLALVCVSDLAAQQFR